MTTKVRRRRMSLTEAYQRGKARGQKPHWTKERFIAVLQRQHLIQQANGGSATQRLVIGGFAAGAALGEQVLKVVEWVVVLGTFRYLSVATQTPELGWIAEALNVGLFLYLTNAFFTPLNKMRTKL